MAVNLLLKRSGTASKRPVAANMALGEIDLNYDAATGGIYYKDSNGAVVKVGPCQVAATAPNSSPAGSSGNSAGEFWYDTANSTLKIWNGTSWVAATVTSGFLPLSGGTMTGNITFNGGQTFPVAGIQSASTTQKGVVQLNDSVTSTSTTEALTANQGKNLQDQINSLSVSSNLTLAGTISGSTGLMLTVTTEGAANGFTVGSAMPTAASSNAEYFTIVTEPGTMTPPGGSAQAVNDGDWWLSTGSAYSYLAVGYSAPYASTTVSGVIQLATDAEVQAGTDSTHAVTPSGLQSKVSDSTSIASSTTIASSAAVKAAYDAATAAALWTENAGELSPATENSVVVIEVPMGIDGIRVSEAALGVSSLIAPAQGSFIDNDHSVVISGADSKVFHVVNSGSGTIAGVASSDENGDPYAYNMQIGELQINGLSGTAGDILTSSGPGLSPTWATLAAENVSYSNAVSGLVATDVQGAIDEVESIAASAQSAASDALPKAGGTMTGNITFQDAGEGIIFADASAIDGITDSTTTVDSTLAASATAVNTLRGNAILKSVLLATGDMIYASAAGTPARLPIGSSGFYLNVKGGAPSWDAFPLTGSTGATNTLYGRSASGSLGTNNTTVGVSAGAALTTGSQRNTVVGQGALAVATSASGNTAIGGSALPVCTGSGNTAIGQLAGQNVTTGTLNVYVGSQAGAGNTASQNVFVGAQTGVASSSTTGHVFVGYRAGTAVTTGTNNTFVGFTAGDAVDTGSNNTIIGDVAGTAALTNNLILAAGTTIKLQVNENGAVGVGSTPAYGTSGQVLTSGGTGAAPTWTNVVASSLLTNTGDIIYASAASTPARLGIGTTGQVLTVSAGGLPVWAAAGGGSSLTGITSSVTTALGTNALDSLTDPSVFNTAVGISAGTALLDGDRNTYVGYQAGQTSTNDYANTFVGHQAGINANGGGGNTAVGTTSGPTGTATSCVFVGVDAGSLTSGSFNVGVGNSAVGKATGNWNTGVGHQAGQGITSGASNTLIGRGAGSAITTGSNNTIIGRYGGTTTLTNNFIVSCNTDIKLQINENDALSIGSLDAFGNPGDVLTSGGSTGAPTWQAPVWYPLTPVTTTSTTPTTIAFLPLTTYRGATVNISASDATGGSYHCDSWMVIHDGTNVSVQLAAPGAHIGPSPYNVTATVSGGNVNINVVSTSANSTKYSAAIQLFAI